MQNRALLGDACPLRVSTLMERLHSLLDRAGCCVLLASRTLCKCVHSRVAATPRGLQLDRRCLLSLPSLHLLLVPPLSLHSQRAVNDLLLHLSELHEARSGGHAFGRIGSKAYARATDVGLLLLLPHPRGLRGCLDIHIWLRMHERRLALGDARQHERCCRYTRAWAHVQLL